jgi:hypothetical protein
VKDENGDLLSDSHRIWIGGRTMTLLLNVHRVNDVRQIEIHIAEPLESWKYKSPGIDQIPDELIQAGGETLQSVSHKLTDSIWNKEELPDQWKESVIVPLYKKDDKTD